jgi:putative ABC transport system permease protein
VDTVLQDFRYAVRILCKRPVFVTLAAITLALGIGANTAIFSVIDAVLLHQLPFRNGDHIFHLVRQYPAGASDDSISIPDYRDLKEQDHAFSNLSIIDCCQVGIIAGGSEPQRAIEAKVSPELLRSLGFDPVLGRNFSNAEAGAGAGHVAILSHSFWQTQFSSNASVVGRPITIDGAKFEIVGVLPPRFLLMPQVDVLVPFVLEESRFRESRSFQNFEVYAEVRRGVSFEQALVETKTVASRLRQQFPDVDKAQDYALVSLREELTGGIRPALLLLMAVAGVVLVIACANMSIMLLARATGRRREFAVRAALGASRGRIFRQVLIESTLLALLGGILSLAIAGTVVRALIAIAPENLPQVSEVGISLHVLAFTFALALAATLLFGSAPAAMHANSGRLWGAMGTRTTTAARDTSRVRSALVVTESALALILTITAGLLLKSFVHLTSEDPGYMTRGIVTFGISLDRAHRSLNAATVLLREVQQKLVAIPGVQAAGASSNLPMERGGDVVFTIVGRATPTGQSTPPDALWRFVTPGYFQALGLHLIEGRWFAESDDARSQPVVVVNRALASTYFSGMDALGQHLQMGAPFSNAIRDIGDREVVGVMGDALTVSLYRPDPPTMYIPLSQIPPTISNQVGALNMMVRGANGNISLSIDAALHNVDPELSIWHLRSIDQLLADYLGPERFNLILVAAFAAVGAILAAIGIYGVTAGWVEERFCEIAVRLAFGAPRGSVVLLIAADGMKLVGFGLSIGFAAVFLIQRFIAAFIHGVSVIDPLTFATVGTLITAVALAAILGPALRAGSVEPAEVLRNE